MHLNFGLHKDAPTALKTARKRGRPEHRRTLLHWTRSRQGMKRTPTGPPLTRTYPQGTHNTGCRPHRIQAHRGCTIRATAEHRPDTQRHTRYLHLQNTSAPSHTGTFGTPNILPLPHNKNLYLHTAARAAPPLYFLSQRAHSGACIE